jgi:methionine synthase II (cobalamin-independent)
LHLCRGNNAGHWLSTGGYEAISKEVFARATRYGIFLLEYDSPRAGSFEPLADLPRDKRVVLGLVSTKSDALETPDTLIARIEEAARIFRASGWRSPRSAASRRRSRAIRSPRRLRKKSCGWWPRSRIGYGANPAQL